MHNLHHTLIDEQFTLYTNRYTIYPVQLLMHSLRYTLIDEQFTLYTYRYTINIVH